MPALSYNKLDMPNANTMILREQDNGVFSAWNYGSRSVGGKRRIKPKTKTRAGKKTKRSIKNKRRTKRT